MGHRRCRKATRGCTPGSGTLPNQAPPPAYGFPHPHWLHRRAVHPAGNPLLFPAPAWPPHPVMEPGHEGHAAVPRLAENSWTGHCWKLKGNELVTTHLCSQEQGPVPHLPSSRGVTCEPESSHSCMSQRAQDTASTGRAGSPLSAFLKQCPTAPSLTAFPQGSALMAHTSTSSTGQTPAFCHTESFTSLNSSFYCVCIASCTTHCSTGAHSSTAKPSPHPGHGTEAGNRAGSPHCQLSSRRVWPTLLETWAVLDKRLLQSIWVLKFNQFID